ncbi:uncharacterized protein LOC124945120 [Impatiens glandulifera]|uniref:uncharacterized protein LOC124945120 n=1 Tax=Impatiens glandulifera TaxID=253017 RepID=UPI001FB19CC7|nr:uncharacterized protein LOC124945120 [Impatiens glandulifera]
MEAAIPKEVRLDGISTDPDPAPPSPPKENADSVIYKLVRVNWDGRLVPATDDEVKEVADMLEEDKGDLRSSENTDQTIGSIMADGVSSGKCHTESSECLLKSQQLEVDAERPNSQPDTMENLGKPNSHLKEAVPSLAARSANCMNQAANARESSNLSVGVVKDVSTSASCRSSRPDLTMLQGEICLNNLSVKELRETFKAAFGRETSVKDKQWLKKRISMGLTNSCDVSTTRFVIKGNKVIKKGNERCIKDAVSSLIKEALVEPLNEKCGGLPVGRDRQIKNPQNVSGKEVLSSDSDSFNDDIPVEQRKIQRVRKPTKRYIEELSEEKAGVSNVKLISLDEKYRQDSLGGSGVQVPYVCRVRRSRPRENFMALMKLEPGSVGMAEKNVNKALGVHLPEHDQTAMNKVHQAKLTPECIGKPLIAEAQKDQQYLVEEMSDSEEMDIDLKQEDPSEDNFDDYSAVSSTSKGGMRRKHHRPWTLSEVIKLVDGVSDYGVGRWSEIKRFVFGSFPHRTAVDLKDKWRNLLKASFQSGGEKAIQNSRKQGSVHIPSSILLQVKDLAEKQEQVPPYLVSSRKVVTYGTNNRNVCENRVGYL